jgi:hypothetical protein
MEKLMAPDERDRRFDKALARHLRSTAPAREAASLPDVPASRSGSCPDSETLAAYHERSLLPEELNSWKEHIVGCAHCQTILAQLEATDEIALQASEEVEVFAAKESSEPVMTARNLETFPAAAPSPSQRADGATPSKKSRRLLLLRGARWQWLAPAGAIAAGLLVWIALHENQPLPLPSLNQVQVATKQAPAPPSPSVSTAVQEVSPSAKAAPSKPQSAADEFASANTRRALEAMKPAQKLDHLAQVSPSRPLADKESGSRKDKARDSSADLHFAEKMPDLDAKSVPGASQATAEVQAQAQAANVQSQNQSNSNSPKAPGPAPLGQTDNKKKSMKTARAAAVPEPAAAPVAGLPAATSMLEIMTLSNPGLIASPGSNVLWRAGRAGLVEFSKDRGASWSRQTSGVLADLLTGSAPSDKICWIVGRVGAVLLTTDGGAHWALISSPLSEDLGGIRATDAQHATIWNARNTKSFETSDGGLTWKPVPHP